MPRYAFNCKHCRGSYELTRFVKDRNEPATCPICHATMVRECYPRKLNIDFNGEGFHCNDYREPGKILEQRKWWRPSETIK